MARVVTSVTFRTGQQDDVDVARRLADQFGMQLSLRRTGLFGTRAEVTLRARPDNRAACAKLRQVAEHLDLI